MFAVFDTKLNSQLRQPSMVILVGSTQKVHRLEDLVDIVDQVIHDL